MKIDNEDIYEKIGNLFYAIAVDQQVKPIEIGELKLLISNDWLPRNFEQADSPTSEAHLILITIDSLLADNVKSSAAFGEFARFYKLHSDVFTKELQWTIINTAEAITKLFRKNTSAQNKIFDRLRKLFFAQYSPIK